MVNGPPLSRHKCHAKGKQNKRTGHRYNQGASTRIRSITLDAIEAINFNYSH